MGHATQEAWNEANRSAKAASQSSQTQLTIDPITCLMGYARIEVFLGYCRGRAQMVFDLKQGTLPSGRRAPVDRLGV